MPGANCSVFGCSTSRKKKYAGITICKIPSEVKDPSSDEEKERNCWREKLLCTILRDRVVDESLRRQIANNNLHICELHFTADQF